MLYQEEALVSQCNLSRRLQQVEAEKEQMERRLEHEQRTLSDVEHGIVKIPLVSLSVLTTVFQMDLG